MKKKNGFTLIELLAIIVILAIIAVITVPIILNIIENSRRGAASDSAYGYKDAINKWYVSKLQEDSGYTLNGNYTVSEGKLNNMEIPLSGDKPTNGTLTYTNNLLTGGCLTIGNYKVTFDSKGSVASTEKGECSSAIPTISSCPGCKFIFTTSDYAIVGSAADDYSTEIMPTAQDGLTEDYRTLVGTGGHPYFLGLIESTTTPGKIGRAFACGVENGTPFCLEGYDITKWSDGTNVGILNTVFPSCNASASASGAYCSGSSVDADDNDGYGFVGVYDDGGYCYVYDGGVLFCDEW